MKIEPMVSILIAARNEEANISNCIESLLKLNYPIDKLEILIGDDNSEDQTAAIVDSYSGKNIKLISIRQGENGIRGKANALAQLAKAASGEVLFFTDADVVVSVNWVRSLLRAFDSRVGMVCGFTAVKTTGWFSAMQNLDWLNAIGMLKAASDMGQSLTALGNNMAVTREAYQSVGGYENIAFSITEDYQLFHELRAKGFKTRYVFSQESKNYTNPERSLSALLQQRKRWMHGAKQLPLLALLVLLFQAVFLGAAVLLSFMVLWAPLFILLRFIIRSLCLAVLSLRVKEPLKFFQLVLFEIYSGVLPILALIYYALPIRQNWKGRTYQ